MIIYLFSFKILNRKSLFQYIAWNNPKHHLRYSSPDRTETSWNGEIDSLCPRTICPKLIRKIKLVLQSGVSLPGNIYIAVGIEL